MVLPRKVYKAMESVVGPENISEDPAVLITYAFNYMGQRLNPKSSRWTNILPEAVVLPGTTEEVQGIVRICNKYGVKFKAHSTGWAAWGNVGMSGAIQIDLRRMNKIIEIDEKNMYAVVEPYVIMMQLQVEARKKGLTCHVVGAGPNCSVLASCTSVDGFGQTGWHASHNNRNPLAVEWVLPTGEILRLGTLGSGAGWFCGDGPGPSLRGVMRGLSGARGGLGIFTKCAVKLYPWPGPPKLEIRGENPHYGAEVPENFKLHFLLFPNWDKLADAVYKLGDAEIGYIVWRYCNPFTLLGLMGATNNDAFRILPMMQEATREWRFWLMILLAVNSMRELEYQEKVLKSIVDETGATPMPIPVEDAEPVPGMSVLALITSCYNSRIFRFTGDFDTSFGADTSWDMCIKGAKVGEETRKKYTDSGAFVDDGPENFWGGPEAHNRHGHLEGLYEWNGADAKSLKASVQYGEDEAKATIKNRIGIGIIMEVMPEKTGPHYGNFHLWLKKIKKALDPKNLSDWTFGYVSGEE